MISDKIYTLLEKELVRLDNMVENREVEEGSEYYKKCKDRIYDLLDRIITNDCKTSNSNS